MPLFEGEFHPHVPKNINVVQREEQQGFNARLAVIITRGFGSIWSFYILVGWMIGWILLATLGVWSFKHDPYPFPFLLFLSNLVQLWALPILAVGQHVLGRKQELQAQEQFETTEKTYHDMEQVVQHLHAQDAFLEEMQVQLKAALFPRRKRSKQVKAQMHDEDQRETTY